MSIWSRSWRKIIYESVRSVSNDLKDEVYFGIYYSAGWCEVGRDDIKEVYFEVENVGMGFGVEVDKNIVGEVFSDDFGRVEL